MEKLNFWHSKIELRKILKRNFKAWWRDEKLWKTFEGGGWQDEGQEAAENLWDWDGGQENSLGIPVKLQRSKINEKFCVFCFWQCLRSFLKQILSFWEWIWKFLLFAALFKVSFAFYLSSLRFLKQILTSSPFSVLLELNFALSFSFQYFFKQTLLFLGHLRGKLKRPFVCSTFWS